MRQRAEPRWPGRPQETGYGVTMRDGGGDGLTGRPAVAVAALGLVGGFAVARRRAAVSWAERCSPQPAPGAPGSATGRAAPPPRPAWGLCTWRRCGLQGGPRYRGGTVARGHPDRLRLAAAVLTDLIAGLGIGAYSS